MEMNGVRWVFRYSMFWLQDEIRNPRKCGQNRRHGAYLTIICSACPCRECGGTYSIFASGSVIAFASGRWSRGSGCACLFWAHDPVTWLVDFVTLQRSLK